MKNRKPQPLKNEVERGENVEGSNFLEIPGDKTLSNLHWFPWPPYLLKGEHIYPEKATAIIHLNTTQNRTEIQSLLGMIIITTMLPDDNGRNPFFQKLTIRINLYTHKSE